MPAFHYEPETAEWRDAIGIFVSINLVFLSLLVWELQGLPSYSGLAVLSDDLDKKKGNLKETNKVDALVFIRFYEWKKGNSKERS